MDDLFYFYLPRAVLSKANPCSSNLILQFNTYFILDPFIKINVTAISWEFLENPVKLISGIQICPQISLLWVKNGKKYNCVFHIIFQTKKSSKKWFKKCEEGAWKSWLLTIECLHGMFTQVFTSKYVSKFVDFNPVDYY